MKKGDIVYLLASDEGELKDKDEQIMIKKELSV